MYSHSHSKRILPRKEEPYRTEFPSHYYSSSSVYSYSPTSSSDCPEHGRSHRRTTLILTVSVVFATLCVLSIAGVAAYLGILSKNINNGSQNGESHLLSTPSETLSENDLLLGPNGRSRSDFGPNDPLDLTNTLESDSKILQDLEVYSKTAEPDLNTKPQIFYSRNSSSSIVRGQAVNMSSSWGQNRYETNQRPEQSYSSSHETTTISPVKNAPSPPHYTVHMFEDGQTKNNYDNTRPQRPRPNRNKLRIPPSVVSTSGSLNFSVHGTEAPAKVEVTTMRTFVVGTVEDVEPEPIVKVLTNAHSTQNHKISSSFENRQGLPVEVNPYPTHSKENIEVTSTTQAPVTLPKAHPTVTLPKFQPTVTLPKSDPPMTPAKPQPPTTPPKPRPINTDHFIPINPIKNTQGDPNLLSNHRVHLTFDRISPEFYDQEPWTPLVIRPNANLDKRPRVEIISPLDTGSTLPPQPKDIYYVYGGALGPENNGPNTNIHANLQPNPSEAVSSDAAEVSPDNEPIRHAVDTDYPAQSYGDEEENLEPDADFVDEEDHNKKELNQEHQAPEIIESSAEIRKPPSIPAYTVIIPHIPNPKPNEMNASTMDSAMAEFAKTPNESSQPSGTMPEDVIKDEDYTDSDDITVGTSPETKIYKLDPDSVDIVPDTLGGLGLANKLPQPVVVQSEVIGSEGNGNESWSGLPQLDTEHVKANRTMDSHLQSTTDFILSTLGSLNLVKASPGDIPQESSDSPLFPPIRSYVGINLPLRPKPTERTESEEENDADKIILLSDLRGGTGAEKKLRLVNGDGLPLSPDLSTTSSLNKVLSMMMTFDAEQNLAGEGARVLNMSHGVNILVPNNPTSELESDDSSNNATREQKSIYRDPKVDTRFRDFGVQHIPVPLIKADEGKQKFLRNNDATKTWTPAKHSSITVNNNSPVYKFVLRKGQSVEDLLKEIFQTYTDKGIGNSKLGTTKVGIINSQTAANVITSKPEGPGGSPGYVDIQITTKTTIPPSTASTAPPAPTEPASTTQEAVTTDPIRTSTSVTTEENGDTSSVNATFTCNSTGIVLSAFARCNGIKDCADNSDEKGCLCVDFLRSQMLHRKICDGIPDCKDFSDENLCEWCSPGQYICAGSRACVKRSKICDGRRDCPRGDDESDCVKIGPSGQVDELEDLSPTYHRTGHLMVRKKGVWGKLCIETFSTVLSHWEVKDLARAVCKAKTFSDFESVEKVVDDEYNVNEPYYELYNSGNESDSDENSYSSSESTPRSAIGFKVSQCKTRVVVKVTCQDLQCGTAPRAFTQAARIVGGSNALPGEWPWQAALYRDGEYQCGATLISSRWLLSAGHCFYHAQDDHWVARLGTLRRGATVLSPYEQVIKITHIFLHPQYKDVGFVNDVSLLRLEKEVNFTDFVRPVCLPDKDSTIRDGRICTVVGWGQLFETGRVFPDTLQEVQLPLISTQECRKRTLFLPLYKLTDEMFCAGFDRGGRDACLGDSGGPLMCPESDGKWSLYGVTSNGYGCARANRPGVYTNTRSYLDWVYEKMSQDSSFTYRDKSKPCLGHRCLLGECLEPKRICNGYSDCLEGSDERNCTWS